MKFINIGFNNMIASDRIIALLAPESAPAKRLVADAKESGLCIDCTSGRRTRAVVLTDSGYVLLSSIQTETLSARSEGAHTDSPREDDAEI